MEMMIKEGRDYGNYVKTNEVGVYRGYCNAY